MRALIQRVSQAQVTVDNKVTGSCGLGFLILLGVGPQDDEKSARLLWDKIHALRVFDDDNGKMNLSLSQVQGEVLIVSQFTLYADVSHGRRPSFTGAAAPDQARALYEYFCALARADVDHVGTGIFGAEMQVELTNSGPVTFWIDTETLLSPAKFHSPPNEKQRASTRCSLFLYLARQRGTSGHMRPLCAPFLLTKLTGYKGANKSYQADTHNRHNRGGSISRMRCCFVRTGFLLLFLLCNSCTRST